jgi:hypothetical protein
MSLNDATAAITAHRDQFYPDWCKERAMLNFVLVLLERVDSQGPYLEPDKGMIGSEPDRGASTPQPGSDHLLDLTERG